MKGNNQFTFKNVYERFIDKFYIDKQTMCWEWTSSKDTCGYGKFTWKNFQHMAHRLSYQFYIGEIPKGMEICHRCDNLSCVSPFHVFLGTHQENMDDMYDKGRSYQKRAICPSMSAYNNGCRCNGCRKSYADHSKRSYWRGKIKLGFTPPPEVAVMLGLVVAEPVSVASPFVAEP